MVSEQGGGRTALFLSINLVILLTLLSCLAGLLCFIIRGCKENQAQQVVHTGIESGKDLSLDWMNLVLQHLKMAFSIPEGKPGQAGSPHLGGD